jgi:hypothetical protein
LEQQAALTAPAAGPWAAAELRAGAPPWAVTAPACCETNTSGRVKSAAARRFTIV